MLEMIPTLGPVVYFSNTFLWFGSTVNYPSRGLRIRKLSLQANADWLPDLGWNQDLRINSP